jgi:hypothetical protein
MPHWIEGYDGTKRYLVDLDQVGVIDVVAVRSPDEPGVRYRLRAIGLHGRALEACLLECDTETEAIEAYVHLRDVWLDGECANYVGSMADFEIGWKWRNKERL